MKRNFLMIGALCTALFLEGIALWILQHAEDSLLHFFTVFALHLAASISMAAAQLRFLPELYQKEQKRVALFLTTLNFMVPILGMTAAWVIVLYGFQKSQDIRIQKDIEDIDKENITEHFPVINRLFGEGALPSVIANEYIPSQKKIQALSMLTQMRTRASLSLIKQTLQDRNDEVRLVGFSMLDKMEKKINEKIHQLKNIVKVQPDPIKRAQSHKELAFTYWELYYQGLVDPQLEQFVIENILEHIEEAKKVIEDDPKLYKLLGRILLEQQRYQEARDAFVKALDLGLPKGEIASFMAQIAFEERNFDRIAYWMRKVPQESINYQLHTLRSVWVREAHA
jgi:tetratricopeptide (TPR) repeat protein